MLGVSIVRASQNCGGFHRPPQTMGDLTNATSSRPTFDPDIQETAAVARLASDECKAGCSAVPAIVAGLADDSDGLCG